MAKKLLHSIWGFSSDIAWGLATPNPITVKTLEAATFRKVEPKVIYRHIEKLKKIGSCVKFVNEYIVSEKQSLVNTNFKIDHSDIGRNIKKAYGNKWSLGPLPEGHEWLAFTFRSQNMTMTKREFNKWLIFSEQVVQEAYSRMKMDNQSWSRYADPEVDFIIDRLELKGKELVADFGCGQGRHSIAFGKKNYQVVSVDFVDAFAHNIDSIATKEGLTITFVNGDCRKVQLKQLFDVVICLYDVVGSFPKEKDNRKILMNIYKHLKNGGFIVLSVMNMELTRNIAKYKTTDIYGDTESLKKLRASNIMQNTGDIFDPDYYLIDEKSGLVYRKEQFENDERLAAEYIIRDKRYTADEICTILSEIGFKLLNCYYVQAGKWDVPLKSTSLKAKEILVIAKK